MKHPTRVAALSPLALFLCAPSSGLGERVAFHPEAGTSLEKTFETDSFFELDDLVAIVDGQDMSAMLGTFEISVEAEASVVVTDTYHELAGGRPKRLERTFESITSESYVSMVADMGGEEQSIPGTSELEGVSVVFTLNDDGEYDVEFAGEEGDQDLLEGLQEDMDLRFLLPDGEVSEGDTWEVEVSAFTALLMPGGDLAMDVEQAPDEAELQELIEQLSDGFGDLEELFEGTCVCTLTSLEDGRAEISIELEVGSAVDLTDMLATVMDTIGEEGGEPIPFEFEIADLNFDIEAEGTLTWDTEAGHARALELVGDGSLALDIAFSVDAMDESHSAEVSVEMSTSMRSSVTFE